MTRSRHSPGSAARAPRTSWLLMLLLGWLPGAGPVDAALESARERSPVSGRAEEGAAFRVWDEDPVSARRWADELRAVERQRGRQPRSA